MAAELSAADEKIAAALGTYARQIREIRRAKGGEGVPMLADGAEGAFFPGNEHRDQLLDQDHHDAEEFRRARKVQRIMQFICVLQVLSSVVLAAIAVPAMVCFLIGDAFGLAATFARVQRHDALCSVLNLAYLVSSLGAAFVQIIAVSGGADEYEPLRARIAAAAVTLCCLPAAAAAVYVLVKPLMLYRYASVAMSEELADAMAERHGGDFGSTCASCELHSVSVADDDGAMQPMTEWMSAGEPGVPIVFLPVKPSSKPKQKKAAPPRAAAVPLLTPPPDDKASSKQLGSADQTQPAKAMQKRQQAKSAQSVDGGATAASSAAAATASAAAAAAAPASAKSARATGADAAMLSAPSSGASGIALPRPDAAVRALLEEDDLDEDGDGDGGDGDGDSEAAAQGEATAQSVLNDDAGGAMKGVRRQKSLHAEDAGDESGDGNGDGGVSDGGGGGDGGDGGDDDGDDDADGSGSGDDGSRVSDGGRSEGSSCAPQARSSSFGGSCASLASLVRDASCGSCADCAASAATSAACAAAAETASEAASPSLGEASGATTDERLTLREKMRGLSSGFKDRARDAFKQVSEVAQGTEAESAQELFARAKALNKEGKYKRACELIEEAYALQPKISTALSAANLRLKLGDFSKAAAAYRKVIAAEASEHPPSASELEMARRKLREAEEGVRANAVNVSLLERKGAPQSLAWHAAQLEELSDELFSESASLYSEFGVQLQDGFREVVRLVRARRLIAAGLTLRQVEKTVTRACLSQRDEQERAWLTTARGVLTGLRTRSAEVQTALREFEEASSAGWKSAGEASGVRTEWRAADDGSLWVRMEAEISASLVHAAAVAHEVDLWPRWVPLCSAGEVVHAAGPTERVTWMQFELPMLRRGALLHWYMSDDLLDRRSILLLGASVEETPDVEIPAAADKVTLADFRAFKVLIRPRSQTSAHVRCVMNVDLKASMPQAIISMVTKKMAGGALATLMREALKLSRDADADGSAHLRRIEQRGEFYQMLTKMLASYFDLHGEDEDDFAQPA